MQKYFNDPSNNLERGQPTLAYPLRAKVRWGEGELHIVDVDYAVIAVVAATVAVESRRRCWRAKRLLREIFGNYVSF